MTEPIASLFGLLLRAGVVMYVLNEIRGLILVAPVMYGIYLAGGTLAAIWIGFCSLVGIAVSAFLPFLVVRKVRRTPT
jgi:hypothetical protein